MNLTAKLIETVEFEVNKSIDPHSLAMIMEHLPPSLTHFFFIKYVEKQIDFYDIKHFIRYMSEETLAYVLNHCEEKISRFSIWIEFLPYLSKTLLPGFIKKHEKTLYGEEKLLKVLPYVEAKEQSQFLWRHEKALEKGKGMIVFLQTCHFTQISKLKFFEKHENKISNGQDLARILSLVFEHKNLMSTERILLENKILPYALKHINIIKTRNEYIAVGNEFGYLRDAFHEQFEEKVQTLSQVKWVLGDIREPEKRLKLFKKHADKIQNTADFNEIFCFLAIPARVDAVVYFIKNHAEKIDSREFFAQLMADIPLKQWPDLFRLFATSRKDHKEYDVDDTFFIFNLINKARKNNQTQRLDLFEFISYFQEVFIKDAKSLFKILCFLKYENNHDSVEPLIFSQHLDKIQDRNVLLELLEYFSDKEGRFKVALKLSALITTERGLARIMKKIKDPALNLELARACQSHMTFGIYFKRILKHLPKEEHLNFALNCRFEVETIEERDKTLKSLDKKMRKPLEPLFKLKIENKEGFFKSTPVTAFSESEKQEISNNK